MLHAKMVLEIGCASAMGNLLPVQIVWLPLSAVVHFETEVFPHNEDMTGWRYVRPGLTSIHFARGHAICACVQLTRWRPFETGKPTEYFIPVN